MELLQIIVIAVFFVCCIVLIFLIMIQTGKGGSLGIFGGASSATPFGSSTVDVVTKATWWGGLLLSSCWRFWPRSPLPVQALASR